MRRFFVLGAFVTSAFSTLGGCSSDEDPPVSNNAATAGRTGSSGSGGKGGTAGTSGGQGGSAGSTTGAGGASGGADGNSGTGGSTTGGAGGTGGATGDGGAPEGGEPGTGGTTGGSAGSGGTSGTGGTGGGSGVGSSSGAGGTSGAGGNPTGVKIVVIGASTAEGKNLDVEMYGGRVGGLADRWPDRYQDYLDTNTPGSAVVNLALAGTGTWEGLPTGSTNSVGAPAPDTAHNITAALAQNPDAIIVNYPSGDVADGWTVDQVMTNLAVIEAAAEADGVPIWVATSQPMGGATAEQISDLEDQRDRTLADFGDHAIDFWTPLAGSDGFTQPSLRLSDGSQHPNAEGQRLLFGAVVAKDIPNSL